MCSHPPEGSQVGPLGTRGQRPPGRPSVTVPTGATWLWLLTTPGGWAYQVLGSKVNLESCPEPMQLSRAGGAREGLHWGGHCPEVLRGITAELGQPTWGCVVQVDGALRTPTAGVIDLLGSRDVCQQFAQLPAVPRDSRPRREPD